MYSLRQLIEGVQNPSLVIREINRIYYKKIQQDKYNTNGINIFDEDWDNLVILDGCRFDQLNEIYDRDYNIKSKTSRGSCTIEFLRGNFHGNEFYDTVYVTANPQLYRHSDSIDVEFHRVINVWEEDGWNQNVGTVLPKVMTEYVKKASNKYPNKRILSHYMQPHYPFLNTDLTLDKGHLTGDVKLDVWENIMRNNVKENKISEIIKSYNRNLEEVLPHVNQLVDQLTGKTVITSDHGNLLGERIYPLPVRDWGHPCNLYVPELVKVPWVNCEYNQRKSITASSRNENIKKINQEIVKDRLAELGYYS